MAEQASKQRPALFVSMLSIIYLILWLIFHLVRHLTIWQWLGNKVSPPTEQEARIQTGGICPP